LWGKMHHFSSKHITHEEASAFLPPRVVKTLIRSLSSIFFSTSSFASSFLFFFLFVFFSRE
jgi:hypothetical protein